MRDVPALQGRTGRRMHQSKDVQAMKKVHAPIFLSFLSFSPFFFLLPQVFPFINFSQSINHDLHLRLIQTLCLHLSHSIPLHKTLTVDHYLGIEYVSTFTPNNPPSDPRCTAETPFPTAVNQIYIMQQPPSKPKSENSRVLLGPLS